MARRASIHAMKLRPNDVRKCVGLRVERRRVFGSSTSLHLPDNRDMFLLWTLHCKLVVRMDGGVRDKRGWPLPPTLEIFFYLEEPIRERYDRSSTPNAVTLSRMLRQRRQVRANLTGPNDLCAMDPALSANAGCNECHDEDACKQSPSNCDYVEYKCYNACADYDKVTCSSNAQCEWSI